MGGRRRLTPPDTAFNLATRGRALWRGLKPSNDRADAAIVAPVFHARRLTEETRLDRDALVRSLASSDRLAFAPDSVGSIPEILRREAREGDVIILMSSGAFGGLPEKLLGML